jgi:hypothetical protein
MLEAALKLLLPRSVLLAIRVSHARAEAAEAPTHIALFFRALPESVSKSAV